MSGYRETKLAGRGNLFPITNQKQRGERTNFHTDKAMFRYEDQKAMKIIENLLSL